MAPSELVVGGGVTLPEEVFAWSVVAAAVIACWLSCWDELEEPPPSDDNIIKQSSNY